MVQTPPPRTTLRWRDLANVAGVLTLVRVPLTVVFWLVSDSSPAMGAVYVVGVGSDILDGVVARRFGLVSQAGAFADGIADKLFHVAVALTLWHVGLVPLWWLPLWFSREIGQAVLAPCFALWWHQAPHQPRHANRLGKLTTVAVGGAVLAVLVGWELPGLLLTAVAGAVGLAATISYAVREVRAHRATSEETQEEAA